MSILPPTIEAINQLKAFELQQVKALEKKCPHSEVYKTLETQLNQINPDPNDPKALAAAGDELIQIEGVITGNDPSTGINRVINQPVAGDSDLLSNLALKA